MLLRARAARVVAGCVRDATEAWASAGDAARANIGAMRGRAASASCEETLGRMVGFYQQNCRAFWLSRIGSSSLRGARGWMTTWWRPDLERIRAEIAAEAELELEVKVEASDGDGVKQGTKRKRAPKTKGPCEHGVKYRSNCKVCSACPHGRRRSQCKECGGSGICEHGRQRNKCKECGGSSICEHGRERSKCKECGGSQICEHGRRRHGCKECVVSRS